MSREIDLLVELLSEQVVQAPGSGEGAARVQGAARVPVRRGCQPLCEQPALRMSEESSWVVRSA